MPHDDHHPARHRESAARAARRAGTAVHAPCPWRLNDVLVLTQRSLARIVREPETLMDVTIQPIVFVLLFAYVFGSAIAHPRRGQL